LLNLYSGRFVAGLNKIVEVLVCLRREARRMLRVHFFNGCTAVEVCMALCTLLASFDTGLFDDYAKCKFQLLPLQLYAALACSILDILMNA